MSNQDTSGTTGANLSERGRAFLDSCEQPDPDDPIFERGYMVGGTFSLKKRGKSSEQTESNQNTPSEILTPEDIIENFLKERCLPDTSAEKGKNTQSP